MKNRIFALGLAVLGCALLTRIGCAEEKGGMPDLAQIDNTCLPTSTANVVLWFGKHGYPKLIPAGATTDEREDHCVHLLMADTGARYDIGTQMETVTSGIAKYIHRAGYACDVEYRGLAGKTEFTQDWLQQNDDPNKGFVLLLTYCQYHTESDSFSNAWNAGHAVTLVNAEPDLLLIHDPAHSSDETGRKIITPRLLTQGMFLDPNGQIPVAGLMLLSGSQLGAPPHASVMLTGAVCITMHAKGTSMPATQAAPNAMLAGTPNVAAVSGVPTTTANRSWWAWLLNCWLGK